MKTLYLLAFLLGSSFAFAQSPYEEPKSSFILIINGVEYPLAEGEKLLFTETFEKPTVSIKLADFKKFDNGAISFNYSKNFSFEFAEDASYRGWTLDGSDFVIMHFEMKVKSEIDLFVNEMVNQFGKTNCVVEKTEKTLGGKTLEGKRIVVSLVGQKLTIDFLNIHLADGKTRFIAFQDVRTAENKPSEESVRVLKLIDETIKYK